MKKTCNKINQIEIILIKLFNNSHAVASLYMLPNLFGKIKKNVAYSKTLPHSDSKMPTSQFGDCFRCTNDMDVMTRYTSSMSSRMSTCG